ncbi:MAG: glycoside hydrolase family 3 protein [Candidatus Saccharibacteria bacterium]|nr:glycoside hydrolase family 3 protein [Candidatus Saccharibacteria bacterium]
MKKLFLWFIAVGMIATGTAATLSVLNVKSERGNNQRIEVEEEPAKVDPVKEQLEAMTLDEKVAQMLVVGREVVTGPDEAEREMLGTVPYGGYILMSGAYGTLGQTHEMVEGLQAASKTPLIIATDQEGGLVQRIQNISYPRPTNIPDMYSVGETKDTEYAKAIGRVIAEELRVIGANVDMAPDADIYSNPYNTVIGRRSFSSDPKIVAKMSQAVAEGLVQNGVAATFKHFPGHGDTAVDSHKNLPVINRTREQLEESDFVPFRNAVENNAQFIMVGHIAMPQITGDNTPATLSYEITTGLLRDEFGYENLIITDGLNMGALTNNYAEEEIYAGAVEAGADLLLLPLNPQLALETIKAKIPESRINESVYRILNFKQSLSNYQYLDVSYFGSVEHREAVGA